MTTDSVKTAEAEAKDAPLGTVKIGDTEFTIQHRPNTLLLSEMARVGAGDPEAMGVFAEFFEVTLGDAYPRFKRAVYRAEDPDEVMQIALSEVIEKTLGRPTE